MVEKVKRVFTETVKSVVIALAFVVFLKGSAVEANQIISSSMTPTLLEGDFILVNKIKYGLHLPFVQKMLVAWSRPERGDVVTFLPPIDSAQNAGKVFIKRIVAIPGDRVEIKRSRLYINGEPVETHPLLASDLMYKDVYKENIGEKEYTVMKHDRNYSFGPVTVPEGYVFAVGDNRDNSHDSRAWGPLPIENIQGKAVIIYFSKTVRDGFENLKRIGSLL